MQTKSQWEEVRLPEKTKPTDHRNQFQRDYGRLIHSAAFRRLQNKTQILGLGESDFYRTRLTHSLEVMQIGEGIVENLQYRYNKSDIRYKEYDNWGEIENILPRSELIRTICLAHDIGHPPFGHGGEVALNYCMLNAGGFEGNGQTLRILSKLEKYTEHDGLNPSRRLLLGILKYPAPYSAVVNEKAYPKVNTSQPSFFKSSELKPPKCYLDTETDVINWILRDLSEDDANLFQTHTLPKAEKHRKTSFKAFDTSIMELADDIAYGVHDLEDGIVMNFLKCSDFHDLIDTVPATIKKRYLEIVEGLFSEEAYLRKKAVGSLVHLLITSIEVVKDSRFKEPLLAFKAMLQPEPKKFLDMLQNLEHFNFNILYIHTI